ncbi:sel1 repeat family protein, partial [Neisseria sp. P0009.S003]
MQGHVKAQYNVGAIYANGQGVRQNLRVAKAWIGMACNNG